MSALYVRAAVRRVGRHHGRQLIEPHKGDKRYVRRDENGQFTESDDVSRSLSQDVRRDAKTESKKGQGDRGDRKGS